MSQIEGKSSFVSKTPTITAGAYTAGKLIGGLMTFDRALQRMQTGLIESLVLSDKAKQSSAIDVVFFKSLPAGTYTDGSTFAPSSADLLLIAGVVSLVAANWAAFSANSVATANAIGLLIANATAGTAITDASATPPPGEAIYAVLVSRGTPTYTSTSDLQLTVGILQD